MAINHLLLPPSILPSFIGYQPSPCQHYRTTGLLSTRKPSPVVCFSSNSSSPLLMDNQSKFKEFPFVSEPQKALMLDLLSMVETRLSSSLIVPCPLPPDVQFYQNPTGTSQAALRLISGTPTSPVDLMLGSWIHSKLPSGGALDITSLILYLKPTTDIPIFLFETIQSSPTSFVLIIDMPPRKDLVLHPDYLKTFYEDTNLDKYRQSLEMLPEVKPYISHSLYVRAFVSPSAVLVRVDTLAGGGGETRAEQLIRDHVAPVAKDIMKTWLDFVCRADEREVDEAEAACLRKRDKIIKNQALEIDLGSTFPNLFGQEVSDRVLGVLREIYNA